MKRDYFAVLAEVDGELTGTGIVGRSDFRERAFVMPRGCCQTIGAEASAPCCSVGGTGSKAFAARFGFREVDRQVEQVRTLGREPAGAPPIEGIQLVTLAERPELLEAAYPLACEGYADMATDAVMTIDLDEWLDEEGTLPGGSFVGLAGDEIVGYAGLRSHDNEGVAEDGLTVVRRDWRRRGLARVLKQHEIAWAAANGYREILTWTQKGNDGMRQINERLGYVYRDFSVTMLADLPLTI
jgi:mycothiol synthase